VYLNGNGLREVDSRGQAVSDDSFYLAFNAHDEAIEFTLPDPTHGTDWEPVVDTAQTLAGSKPIPAQGVFAVAPRSVVVLRAEAI
jgi:glycogen operon protein